VNIIALVFLMAGFSIAGLFSLIYGCSEQDETVAKGGILCSLVGIGLLIWIIFAGCQPYEVARQFEVTPTKVMSPDGTFIQMVTFTDLSGKQFIQNCNEEFGGVLPDDAVVVIKEYKQYYYCGVSYVGNQNRPNYSLRPAKR
jgi:hypothetical protein